MFKRILLPVSGKTHCKRARKALEKAKKVCDGEITLLHVTAPIPQIIGGEQREQLIRDNQAEGLRTMAPLIEDMKEAGIPFRALVKSGTPAETIVQVADEEKMELIVMFTDGREDLEDVFFGAITERVLRNTAVDLLAVKS